MQQLGSVKGAQQGNGNLGRGHPAKGPRGCSCVLLTPTFHLCSHTQRHRGVSGWFGLNTGDRPCPDTRQRTREELVTDLTLGKKEAHSTKSSVNSQPAKTKQATGPTALKNKECTHFTDTGA